MKNCLILVIFCWISNSEAQNISANLQACYAFDCDNAVNYSNTGSALNGTLHNVSCATGRNNGANTAYGFQGNTNSYIELPSDYRIKGDTVCVSGWYYIDTYNTEQFIIFTKNNCGNYNYEAYNLNTIYDGALGHHVFRICKAASLNCSYAWIHSSTTPVAGNWYHIVFFMSNTKMWLYINNVLEGLITHNVAFDYVATKKVLLGVTNETANNQPFHGRIDDLRFYNRELTPQEISLLYSQDPGCNSSSQAVPVSAFSATNNACVGDSISFTDASTNNPNAWNWQLPGATPSNAMGNSVTAYYSTPGLYTVSLTASNAAGSGNVGTQTIQVSPLPTISLSIGSTTICNGQSLNIIATGGVTYSWRTSQNGPSMSVSPNVNTVYTVSATGANGCQNSSSVSVVVTECTAVESYLGDERIQLYPNPSGGKIYVNHNGVISVTVTDLSGRRLQTTTFSDNELTSEVDLKTKTSGFYYIEVYSSQGRLLNTTKILLKN